MTAPLPVVIIGAGMAAYGVAREFRKLDKETPLLIVAGDGGGSYAKPMLSNAFALGKAAAQLVSHSAEQMAATLDATVLTRTEVSAIDSAAQAIETAQGERIGYRQLVLALGAQPIRLAVDGDAAGQILSVNQHRRLRADARAAGGAGPAGARGDPRRGADRLRICRRPGRRRPPGHADRPEPAAAGGTGGAGAVGRAGAGVGSAADHAQAVHHRGEGGAQRRRPAGHAGRWRQRGGRRGAVGGRAAAIDRAGPGRGPGNRGAASSSTATARPARPASTRWATAPNTAPRPAARCCRTSRRC